MEPIITMEDLKQKPQPVTLLFELCQKQGKQVDIKYWRKKDKNIASVYVDGEFIASGSSEQKEISKLNAAREALHKLSQSMPVDNGGMIENYNDVDGKSEIEGAKQKLHELCSKKKWLKPTYKYEILLHLESKLHMNIFWHLFVFLQMISSFIDKIASSFDCAACIDHYVT